MTFDGPPEANDSRLHQLVRTHADLLETFLAKEASRGLSADEQSRLIGGLDELVAGFAAEQAVTKSEGHTLSVTADAIVKHFRCTALGRALCGVGSSSAVSDDAFHAFLVDSEETTGPELMDRWIKSQASMDMFAALPDLCMQATGRMADRVADGAIWVLGAEHPRVAFGLTQAGGNRAIVPVKRSVWANLSDLKEAPALVMLPNVLEWLNDDEVTDLLISLRARLVSGGGIVMSTLSPSQEASFFAAVFGWKVYRRSPSELESLLASSDLEVLLELPSPESGTVVVLKGRGDPLTVDHLS